ncbi:primosomal protein N' [Spirulina major]|uniref:primosomal protein N' n=1 Tax=Spirulina major TaxID=270636 RepID=UPI0009353E2B|nr:primosomal protein N' [Spirulina major]
MQHAPLWVDILVDCPTVQAVFTYQIPLEFAVAPGDVVQVPFGVQQLGGIVLQRREILPPDIAPDQIRPVLGVIAPGFLAPDYLTLLQRVATDYCTPLITVVRAALPPGLLGKSQRRIQLWRDRLPPGAETFCSAPAQAVLALLDQQPEGDYSMRYLKQKVRQADKGVRDLMARDWVRSYLEPPRYSQPQKRQAITLLQATGPAGDLTKRQQEILTILQRQGGQMWLMEFLSLCRTTTDTLKKLETKGYVVIQDQEVLRLEQGEGQQRDAPKVLTAAQQSVLGAIASSAGFQVFLLHGVTGSGKTEVYLQAIAPRLAAGQSALVLVPEIGLTPQLTDRFRARFGDRVYVYHSDLSEGERYDTWRTMLDSGPHVLIGTRSAVFAPLRNLGMIILDEEHDASFKQEQPSPTYHARTVAQWRAELAQCALILGSATPALETWQAAHHPPAQYLTLPQRIHDRPLPPVEIVDMRVELKRGNRSIFSDRLHHALTAMQTNGQQGILFIPRRGHSTFVSCRSCGEVLHCPHCDVSLSYHHTHDQATPRLICHYCNHHQAQPPHCPACSSPYLKQFGSGTQRVITELARQFPQLRLLRFDSDTTRTKGAHRALLTRFAQGHADVLVGTQMLTKGLDVAQVTVVGIVAADGLLHLPQYRATERAFQVLTQVAGRAGRGEEPGRVILQTYSPDHAVVQAVKAYDYSAFMAATLQERHQHYYPPYCRLVLVRVSGLDQEVVRSTAELVAMKVRSLCAEWARSLCAEETQSLCAEETQSLCAEETQSLCAEWARSLCAEWDQSSDLPPSIQILGPAPAPIMRIKRRFRWHLVVKLPPHVPSLPDFSPLYALCPSTVILSLNIDPLYFD